MTLIELSACVNTVCGEWLCQDLEDGWQVRERAAQILGRELTDAEASEIERGVKEMSLNFIDRGKAFRRSHG